VSVAAVNVARVMTLRLVTIVVVPVAAGAFLLGRELRPAAHATSSGQAFHLGYLAGREDAFAGYDGGWRYGAPYVVVLRRGGRGITYRFAQRWPMRPGVAYRACGHSLCRRAIP